MDTKRFKAVLKVVLHHEGGWSDHKDDPGGATYKGITLETLAHWWAKARRDRRPTKQDLRNMTRAEIAKIYRVGYWDKLRCGDLPVGVDLLAFDAAVNQGVGRASKLLQLAAGARPDGIVGARTVAAVRARYKLDARDFISKYGARRMQAYGSLVRLFGVFGLGWSRRLMDIVTRAALEAAKER